VVVVAHREFHKILAAVRSQFQFQISFLLSDQKCSEGSTFLKVEKVERSFTGSTCLDWGKLQGLCRGNGKRSLTPTPDYLILDRALEISAQRQPSVRPCRRGLDALIPDLFRPNLKGFAIYWLGIGRKVNGVITMLDYSLTQLDSLVCFLTLGWVRLWLLVFVQECGVEPQRILAGQGTLL